MIKNYLHYAVAAAFFVASGTGNVAFAENELEAAGTAGANDSMGSAQRLVIRESDGKKIEITGTIGFALKIDLVPIADVVFYSFQGRKGDVVKLDIDGGSKTSSDPLRGLDSLIAIFAPDGTVLAQKNDVLSSQIDEGSITRFDPWIENIFLPVNGIYTVGVTSDARYPDGSLRVFLPGGSTTPFVGNSVSNGTYKLIISGVSPSALQISIDIKPNAKSITTHANSHGKIPVALITSDEFDALKADRDSIKFGPPHGTGTIGRCNKNGADLLCHFDKGDAGFCEDDTEGMVTGTIGGMPFEGRGWLKVIPVSRKD
jgi:hypothetical protein